MNTRTPTGVMSTKWRVVSSPESSVDTSTSPTRCSRLISPGRSAVGRPRVCASSHTRARIPSTAPSFWSACRMSACFAAASRRSGVASSGAVSSRARSIRCFARRPSSRAAARKASQTAPVAATKYTGHTRGCWKSSTGDRKDGRNKTASTGRSTLEFMSARSRRGLSRPFLQEPRGSSRSVSAAVARKVTSAHSGCPVWIMVNTAPAPTLNAPVARAGYRRLCISAILVEPARVARGVPQWDAGRATAGPEKCTTE